jgi:hypothetical protein
MLLFMHYSSRRVCTLPATERLRTPPSQHCAPDMAALAAHRLALLEDDGDEGPALQLPRATGGAERSGAEPGLRQNGRAGDVHEDGGAALAEEDEQEYVSVKRRRLLEAQGRYQRLGKAGAPTTEDASTARDGGAHAPREQPQVRASQQSHRWCVSQALTVLSLHTQEKASLLVRAAELKKERPAEDDTAKRAREELEILRSVMARQLFVCSPPHSRAHSPAPGPTRRRRRR